MKLKKEIIYWFSLWRGFTYVKLQNWNFAYRSKQQGINQLSSGSRKLNEMVDI